MRATSLKAVRSKVHASLEKRGIVGTIRAAPELLIMRRWWALQELYFDITHGVRTRGHVTHDDRVDEDPAYAHAQKYQGVGVTAFRESLAALDIDEKDYAFVDLGCGRGRALVLALEHSFRRIIGVELSPELTRDAQLNFERLRRKGRPLPPVEVICADATTYAFPPLPLVVFLYNSFDETLMAPFIRHLRSSLAASGQPAFLIYITPMQRHITDAAPFLEIHRELRHGVVYRSRLAASAD